MELDALITDLALILIVAGVVTLLFKKLKQPVVLGYIVAGFLVGPNFVFFPTIVDEGDINLWAELGIIVLLFSLGLEFSFKKLFQVGASAVLTALVVVSGMMLAGYGAGYYISRISTVSFWEPCYPCRRRRLSSRPLPI